MSNDTIMEAALSTLDTLNDFLDNLEVYSTQQLVGFAEQTLNHKSRRGGMKEATYRRFLINKIRRETCRSGLSHQQVAEKANRNRSKVSKRGVKNTFLNTDFISQ
jgi:hypothetical protein